MTNQPVGRGDAYSFTPTAHRPGVGYDGVSGATWHVSVLSVGGEPATPEGARVLDCWWPLAYGAPCGGNGRYALCAPCAVPWLAR
eukprot:1784799-Prymnesium_polylepis.1